MSDPPVEYQLQPPLMGEHTVEVLKELGYWKDQEWLKNENLFFREWHADKENRWNQDQNIKTFYWVQSYNSI